MSVWNIKLTHETSVCFMVNENRGGAGEERGREVLGNAPKSHIVNRGDYAKMQFSHH